MPLYCLLYFFEITYIGVTFGGKGDIQRYKFAIFED